MRRGFQGLGALVQTKLEQSPFSGHMFVFRIRFCWQKSSPVAV